MITKRAGCLTKFRSLMKPCRLLVIIFLNCGFIIFVSWHQFGIYSKNSRPVYDKKTEANIPSLEEEEEEERNALFEEEKYKIFFLETYGIGNLNARQACAVESAAKHNPEMDVNVLFFSPLNFISDSNMFVDTLLSLHNVALIQIDKKDFMRGTSVENLITDGRLQGNTEITGSRLSDIFRFLVLYKFGGIYFDMDVIVLKPIDNLRNFTCKQDGSVINAGAMGFDRGHPLLKACLEELSVSLNRAVVDDLLTKLILRTCRVGNLGNLSHCEGINVLEPYNFHPFSYNIWEVYFRSIPAQFLDNEWEDSYAIHVWDEYSASMPVCVGSGVLYDKAAKENCPLIYDILVNTNTFSF